MKNDCVFCGIVEGEVPGHMVYEDEKVVAFLDANPVSRGHTLVVPREHVEDIHGTEHMDYMHPALARVADAVRDAFDPEGINIAQNNGEAAGQEVFHLHFHVTPIYTGNELEITYNRSELEDGEETAQRISESIERVAGER
jgi:histidine triad (HIT) family protein